MKWRTILIFTQLRLKGKYVYLFSLPEYYNMLRINYFHQNTLIVFRTNISKITFYKILTYIQCNELFDDFSTQD